MTTRTDIQLAGIAFGGSFADLRSRISDAYARRKTYRTTIAELEDLTDRELADLGITKTMIKDIAYEAAYGK